MLYRLLGHSGLRVSEAALGTMTFGEFLESFEDRTSRIAPTTKSRASQRGRSVRILLASLAGFQLVFEALGT
jgi:aryl-alcohol dehydrogenase-like predicted oxidoreductase